MAPSLVADDAAGATDFTSRDRNGALRTGTKSFGNMNNSIVESKFLSHPGELGVVAVGFSGGQGKAGVDTAPSVLIESGLLTQIRDELGYKLHGDDQVHFYNDLTPKQDPPYRGMKNALAVSAVTRLIADQTYSHSREGRLVLTLGGDHSIAIGTIGGTAKATRERIGRDIAVIWVDAHADINTPETSGSGNIHGMPVAFLTGLAREDKEEYFGWLSEDNQISVKKLVYIGLRDVDLGEKRILREHGIKAFSMFDIDRYGIGRVMEMALAHIGNDTPIHLSFDVDALDPLWAPSTGTPVRGGLTLREGDYICECVHETGSLIAVDLVEVNPSLAQTESGAKETVRAGCSIVRVRKYHWPAIALNIWMLIMLAAACTVVGVFATFVDIQQRLLLPIPWYFPYFITVGCLAIGFIGLLLMLIVQRRLLPSIVMIGGFIVFVLWMVGLIVVSIELWGPTGSINSSCNLSVFNMNPTGQTLNTLAWLEQRSICQSWQAVFAFGLVGAIFLLWIMVMAYQVFAEY
ncbi:arginase-domain-containing protein [Thozetella sp. PMI_491]|nr:arginase-domain-containing protein [Thozetella sp. PMI_491]